MYYLKPLILDFKYLVKTKKSKKRILIFKAWFIKNNCLRGLGLFEQRKEGEGKKKKKDILRVKKPDQTKSNLTQFFFFFKGPKQSQLFRQSINQ